MATFEFEKIAAQLVAAERHAERRAAEEAFVRALVLACVAVAHVGEAEELGDVAGPGALAAAYLESLPRGPGGHEVRYRTWARHVLQAGDPERAVLDALRALARELLRRERRDPVLRSVEDKIRRVVAVDVDLHLEERPARQGALVHTRRPPGPTRAPAPPPPRPRASEAGGSLRHASDAEYAAWLHTVLAHGPQTVAALARRLEPPARALRLEGGSPANAPADGRTLDAIDSVFAAGSDLDALSRPGRTEVLVEARRIYRKVVETWDPVEQRVVARYLFEESSFAELEREEGWSRYRVQQLVARFERERDQLLLDPSLPPPDPAPDPETPHG